MMSLTQHSMLYFEEIALLAVVITNLALGALVLVKNPRHAVHISFFAFVAGMSSWAAGIALLYLTQDFIFDKLILASAFVMFGSLLCFARSFPDERVIAPRFFWSMLPLVLALCILPFNLFIRGITTDSDGLVQPFLGPLFPALAITIACYYAAAIRYFLRRFRSSRGRARMQMTYLFAGLGLFMASVIAFDIILPIAGIYRLNLLGPLASVCFVGCTAYAIVRHQLMDIRIIVQRGLIYSVLAGATTLSYLVILNVLGLLFGSETDTPILLGAGLTTAIGIFTVPAVERSFRRMTDPWFFKDTYDYADALDTLSDSIEAHLELRDLTRAAETELARILRAESVHIRLAGDPQADAEPALSVPITRDATEIATICIGPKRSGDAYAARDLKLARTFARQAATAFERARLYESVSRHAAELSETVEARTRELRESQEHERQMLADISHNLQTPLAIIQTRLDRLKRSMLYDGEMQSFEHSLASLSTFIYDLLALARLDRSPATSFEPVDLSALVRDISEEITTIAATRGIAVSMEIEAGITMPGDAKLLREAIMNVASNAVKYMRLHGGKRIRFTLARSGGRLTLCVIDTGIGIAPDDQRRVFERFYRGRETAYGIRGTGLGLAITKRIVEQHAGMIELTSELGQGTTFCLWFPDTAT